jgi:hypothetical protein
LIQYFKLSENMQTPFLLPRAACYNLWVPVFRYL